MVESPLKETPTQQITAPLFPGFKFSLIAEFAHRKYTDRNKILLLFAGYGGTLSSDRAWNELGFYESGPAIDRWQGNYGASEGDEEIQGNLGDAFVTTTSSYGSYSINSVRESNQKLMNDAVMTESSTHLKEDTGYYKDVDDYLANFLNDDPALLDETATSNTQIAQPIESSRFEPFQLEPLQAVCPALMSYPGITRTTQIIWPHEPMNPPANSTVGGQENNSDDEGKSSGFTFSPTCILSTMVGGGEGGKTWTRRFISGAVVMALIAVAVVYSVGGLGDCFW
ncbi:hypothetical protein MLD38_004090 [Melastoma candidum]|uniref:Uncharacterized protein n=1 Tax=Melastoma candidum TaxID=119954 RepID=A0ACB9S436_9MYRT|nr:hypothetical protein MLD38_004090 [Melastoma candidum]